LFNVAGFPVVPATVKPIEFISPALNPSVFNSDAKIKYCCLPFPKYVGYGHPGAELDVLAAEFRPVAVPKVDVTGCGQINCEVTSQVIVCPFVIDDVVNILLLDPAFIPFTFHW
jgi:hypothetical protein